MWCSCVASHHIQLYSIVVEHESTWELATNATHRNRVISTSLPILFFIWITISENLNYQTVSSCIKILGDLTTQRNIPYEISLIRRDVHRIQTIRNHRLPSVTLSNHEVQPTVHKYLITGYFHERNRYFTIRRKLIHLAWPSETDYNTRVDDSA